MEFIRVKSDDDLSGAIRAAKEIGFTKESNPTNSAFIDEQTLRVQLNKVIELYRLEVNNKSTGCIVIEKSPKESGT
jgi:hypothetical protein